MNFPDLVNGSFELGGAVMIGRHINKLRVDKMVRGVDWLATAFFTAWGAWNCWFYPHLGQWFSFVGGLAIVIANTVWLGMMIYYIRKERFHAAVIAEARELALADIRAEKRAQP